MRNASGAVRPDALLPMPMKPSLKLSFLALLPVTALVSCTPGERGALIGGALGAGTGALVGDTTGALVGGAVGAIAGSEISKNRAHRRAVESGYYGPPPGGGWGPPPPPGGYKGGYRGGHRGW
jgi:hypothetical protein